MHYKKIVSALFILPILVFKLSAAGCGLPGSETDFSLFMCPNQNDKETTLYNVNYKTNTFVCKYAEANSNVVAVEKKIGCDQLIESALPGPKKQSTINGKFTSLVVPFANRMQMFGINIDNTAMTTLLDTKSIYDNINSVYTKTTSQDQSWANKFNDLMSKHALDSTTNHQHTVAAVIGGVFTADPSFFEEGFINAAGEVMINHDYYYQNLDQAKNDKDLLSWIKSLWSGSSQDIVINSPVDFIDKQVLGYIITISDTLRHVANQIVAILFLMGALYSTGYYVYNKYFEKYGNEQFTSNKLSFLVTTILSFLFFSAPTIDDNMILDHNVSKVGNLSSLGQETLRYAVQSGTYFANMAADGVMSDYLNHVAKKSGFLDISKQDINDLYTHEKDLRRQKMSIVSEIGFYNEVCRKYYGKDENSVFAKRDEKEADESLMKGNTSALESAQVGAQRLTYEMCSNVENEILSNVTGYFNDAYALSSQVKLYADLYNTDSTSAKGMEGLIKLMIFGQNTFGWIFMPAEPISYYFFKNSNVFLYDRINSSANQNTALSGMLQNKTDNIRTEIDLKTTMTEKIENGLVSLGTSFVIQNGFWTLVPGFTSVYDAVDEMMQKAYMGPIDIHAAILSTNSKPGILGMIISGAKKSVLSIGKNIPYIGSIFSVMDSVGADDQPKEKSKLIQFIMSIMAFLIAIVVTSFMITGVTILGISAFLSLKITIYFIEVLILFLSIPVMGIFSAMMSKGGGKNYLGHFSSTVGIIAITPTLIVMINSMIVPVSEFFEKFFVALMNIILVVIKNGETFMRTVENNANSVAGDNDGLFAVLGHFDLGSSIEKIAIISSITGIIHVFSLFATIIMGFFLIFAYKGWFIKLVGLDQLTDNFREAVSEMKQSAASRIINPVG